MFREVTATVNTSTEDFPKAPPLKRITCVTFSTCPETKLEIRVVKDNNHRLEEPVDEYGFKQDMWWGIFTPGLPLRLIRLYDGYRSFRAFVRRYGFQDKSGCLHHKQAMPQYADAATELPPFDLDRHVPKDMQPLKGVPQFERNSGVCWFAASCCVFLTQPEILKLFYDAMPATHFEYCQNSMCERSAALNLWRSLWHDYNIGDDVNLPPEMNGRNGMTEMIVLLSKLGIPIIRMNGNSKKIMNNAVRDRKGKRIPVNVPKDNEKHFLVLRYIDGDHTRDPILRRVVRGTRRYRLLGVLAGSRKCGHQIGWVTLGGNWRKIMVGDADLHKEGIGPLFIHFDGEEWEGDRWWEGCRHMMHVTKFGMNGRSFCNLNPHNEEDDAIERREYRGTNVPGSLSLDVVYVLQD